MFKKYPNIADFLQKTKKDKKQQKPAFIDHMFAKIDEHISQKWRVLILTLTKKSSEEITNFLVEKWYRAFYLHSEIATIDRREIIKKLKSGEIDIIVWINLLREGIDLPEVSLIAILDADKQGFLRSTTALVQNIWRASRNPKWEVILYADQFTEAMTKSLRETYRRRGVQQAHNEKHGITPSIATSNIKNLESVKTDEELAQGFSALSKGKVKRLKRMTKKEKDMITKQLRLQLEELIKERKFEDATIVRDQLKEIDEMK